MYYENYSNEAELSSLSIENPFQINNAYASDPFSPLELNPIIWLDGEDVDGDGDTNDNPSNGGTISAWKNKSSA